MSARRPWRLLVTEPADGATNMAIDETLWRGRQAGTAPPTLRFFAWAPPTVSVGYGQPLGDDIDVVVCRRLGVGIVRRPTGGSAIYHDGPARELTYAVAASSEDLEVTADLLETYRWIGLALVEGLRILGAPAEMVPVGAGPGPTPAFCFARTGRYEIEIGGRKVVGSAQRWRQRCVLQHGSILLDIDAPRLRQIFPTTPDPVAPLTTLARVLGRRPDFAEVVHALGAAFARVHGLRLDPGGLTADELAIVETLARDKYASEAWRVGAR